MTKSLKKGKSSSLKLRLFPYETGEVKLYYHPLLKWIVHNGLQLQEGLEINRRLIVQMSGDFCNSPCDR